jgi:type IV pilus assembly protein PilM
LKDQEVVSALGGNAVMVKQLLLSKEKIQALAQGAAKGIEAHIPFDLSDVYFDYQDLGPEPGQGPLHRVLLAASKKDEVLAQQGLLAQSGLTLLVLDIEAFALINCLTFNYPSSADKAVCLLDIGERRSIFCVCLKGQPLFLRELGLGGLQITQGLAAALGISEAKAEGLKVAGQKEGEVWDLAVVREALRQVFSDWGQKLQGVLDLYQSLERSRRLSPRIFLTGGGSQVPGLVPALAGSMGLELVHLDPFRRVNAPNHLFDRQYLRQIGPQFAVAMGLALRKVS